MYAMWDVKLFILREKMYSTHTGLYRLLTRELHKALKSRAISFRCVARAPTRELNPRKLAKSVAILRNQLKTDLNPGIYIYFLVINGDLTLQARSSLTRPVTLEAPLPRRRSLIPSFCSSNTTPPPLPPAGSLIQCMTSRQSFKSLQAKIQPLRVRLLTDELHMQKQDFPSMGKARAASVRLQGPARAVFRGERRRLFLLHNKAPIF